MYLIVQHYNEIRHSVYVAVLKDRIIIKPDERNRSNTDGRKEK